MNEENANDSRVTCPGCGTGYRWHEALTGRVVPCKQCATSFIVPKSPGVGKTHAPERSSEDSVYALDVDDEEIDGEGPPLAVAGKCPSCNTQVKDGAVLCLNCGFNLQEGSRLKTAIEEHSPPPPPSASVTETGEDAEEGEVPVKLSAAEQAERREQQRKAAAATEPVRTWRDYKLLIIIVVFLCLVALTIIITASVSDALDGILGMVTQATTNPTAIGDQL